MRHLASYVFKKGRDLNTIFWEEFLKLAIWERSQVWGQIFTPVSSCVPLIWLQLFLKSNIKKNYLTFKIYLSIYLSRILSALLLIHRSIILYTVEFRRQGYTLHHALNLEKWLFHQVSGDEIPLDPLSWWICPVL